MVCGKRGLSVSSTQEILKVGRLIVKFLTFVPEIYGHAMVSAFHHHFRVIGALARLALHLDDDPSAHLAKDYDSGRHGVAAS
jgi:hypothetical protein